MKNNKMWKNIKSRNAITIISLVITVILLIILAAIVINLSIGENGLLDKAKYAKEKYINEQAKEEQEILLASNSMDQYLMGARENNKAEKVEITDIVSGFSIQNYSVRIGDMIFIQLYYKKDSQVKGWKNNVAKISIPPKTNMVFTAHNDNSGYASAELLLTPDGNLSFYDTQDIGNLFVSGYYYIGDL